LVLVETQLRQVLMGLRGRVEALLFLLLKHTELRMEMGYGLRLDKVETLLQQVPMELHGQVVVPLQLLLVQTV